MAEAIIMPKLGLQMKAGIITQWYVKEGDAVTKDMPVFAIETDKLSSDVESPVDGVILKIAAAEGDEVEITKACCYVGAEGESWAGESQTGDDKDAGSVSAPEPVTAVISPARSVEAVSGRIFATPLARKTAGDLGVDLIAVKGSGPGGRIVNQDVVIFSADQRVRISPAARKIAAAAGVDTNNLTGSGPGGRICKADVLAAAGTAQSASQPADNTENRPLSAMRRTIGRRLTESKQTIPHVYFRNDVDAGSLLEARRLFQDAAYRKNGNKLTVNDIILKATAQALAEFPEINTQTDGEQVTVFPDVQLGLAVSIAGGLIVPVIRRAQEKSAAEISREAFILAEKARTGKLMPEEFTGGTFTVSNLGGFGLDDFQAIINPPESGILAVGSIKKRPAVVADELVVRPMMTITGSFDHRLVDGALAARFMVRLTELLEHAVELFI